MQIYPGKQPEIYKPERTNESASECELENERGREGRREHDIWWMRVRVRVRIRLHVCVQITCISSGSPERAEATTCIGISIG